MATGKLSKSEKKAQVVRAVVPPERRAEVVRSATSRVVKRAGSKK